MTSIASRVKRRLRALAPIALEVACFSLFDMSCPILSLFGFPCPTCGMTRVMVSLLRLDLKAYAMYQSFALPPVCTVLFLYFASECKPGRFKTIGYAFSAATMFGNTCLYLYRLWLAWG